MIQNIKPEVMHLMVLSRCDHNCELCCNKLYNIEEIPVATVQELKTIHTLCITGGEPFLVEYLSKFAKGIKKQYPNIKHLYVYTSGGAILSSSYSPLIEVGSVFDGINFAPKTKKDWVALKIMAATNLLLKHKISSIPQNRLYVFKDQKEVFENMYNDLPKKLNLNVIYRTWDKEFKTPDNEIFRRLPVFLG